MNTIIVAGIAFVAIILISKGWELDNTHYQQKLAAAESHTAFLYRELDEANTRESRMSAALANKDQELAQLIDAVRRNRTSPGKLAQLLQPYGFQNIHCEAPDISEAARVS